MVSRSKDEVQEDRGVPDLRQGQERVPDLYARPGVRSACTGVLTLTSDHANIVIYDKSASLQYLYIHTSSDIFFLMLKNITQTVFSNNEIPIFSVK